MYCNKCGQANPDDAVYCKKCRTLMEAEEETLVASRPADALRAGELFSITPMLKFVYAGYVAAIVAAFLVVAMMTILIPSLSTVFAVIAGLLLLLLPAYFHVKQKLVRYRLTDTTVEIDKGLISRTTQNIPLRRIQDVTVSSTRMQRMLGFGDIVIDNASEDGGKVVLDNIDSPRKYADLLLRQMRQLDR